MFPEFLAITTLACLIESVFASSLPVPLPLQPATCVTTLDWINDDPRCPPLIGFVCLCLDCLTVYRTCSVKVVILHLCLRVEHLDPTLPRTLQYELAMMDPADSECIRAALQAQGKRLFQTEEQFNAVRLEMQAVTENVHNQVSLLTSQNQQIMARLDALTAASAAPAPAPGSISHYCSACSDITSLPSREIFWELWGLSGIFGAF